jgi:hypothetical protein
MEVGGRGGEGLEKGRKERVLKMGGEIVLA